MKSQFNGHTRHTIAHIEPSEVAQESKISSVNFICYQHAPTSSINTSIKVNGRDTEAVRNLKNVMQEKIPSITSGILHKTKPKTVRQEISENGRSISVIFEPEKATSIESLLKEPKEHIPRVFISYSHDSEEHKEWVAKLAQKLNSIGIWVLFDQWDTNLGSDLHHFMNSGIKNSDRILAICTEKYNDKSEENQGGAAYERMLMTPELFRNTASTKIIPVVRGAQEPKTPSYLTSRFYIDFTDDSQFESNWLKLGHILLSQESQRPAFGV